MNGIGDFVASIKETRRLVDQVVIELKGEAAGHPFRGNQWTGSAGGEESMSVPDLSENERKAIEDYKNSSLKVNRDARSGNETDTTRALDSAIQKSTLSTNATVLRGINPNPDRSPLPTRENEESGRMEFLSDYTGMEFSDSGFISTTFSKDIANDFVIPGHAIVFEIDVPRGSKALYISGIKEYSGKDNEHELLLPRNTKFSVVGDSTANGTRTIKVSANTGG